MQLIPKLTFLSPQNPLFFKLIKIAVVVFLIVKKEDAGKAACASMNCLRYTAWIGLGVSNVSSNRGIIIC